MKDKKKIGFWHWLFGGVYHFFVDAWRGGKLSKTLIFCMLYLFVFLSIIFIVYLSDDVALRNNLGVFAFFLFLPFIIIGVVGLYSFYEWDTKIR